VSLKDSPGNIGETLRILSVVTLFGIGRPPLHLSREMKTVDDQIVNPEAPVGSPRRIAPFPDLISLLHLVRLLHKYEPDFIQIHNFDGKVLRSFLSAFSNWCIQKIEHLFAAITNAWSVPSPQQHREITTEFSIAEPQKVRILPLGIPLAAFETLPPPPPDRDELVVAWFGRLVAVKNVPLLIEVIEKSLQAIPIIRFLIAGDGPERASVKNLAERSGGRVEYLGWQRDVRSVIDRADVLLQTSFNEGTPAALIQGMAAARPFLSTAVGGLTDMVTGQELVKDRAHWFTNGVLVPQEAAPFVSALQSFAQDRPLLLQMGIVARQWALAQYAESKMLETTHRLYSEYLSAKGHRVAPPLPTQMASEVEMTRQLSRLAEQTGQQTPTDVNHENERLGTNK